MCATLTIIIEKTYRWYLIVFMVYGHRLNDGIYSDVLQARWCQCRCVWITGMVLNRHWQFVLDCQWHGYRTNESRLVLTASVHFPSSGASITVGLVDVFFVMPARCIGSGLPITSHHNLNGCVVPAWFCCSGCIRSRDWFACWPTCQWSFLSYFKCACWTRIGITPSILCWDCTEVSNTNSPASTTPK